MSDAADDNNDASFALDSLSQAVRANEDALDTSVEDNDTDENEPLMSVNDNGELDSEEERELDGDDDTDAELHESVPLSTTSNGQHSSRSFGRTVEQPEPTDPEGNPLKGWSPQEAAAFVAQGQQGAGPLSGMMLPPPARAPKRRASRFKFDTPPQSFTARFVGQQMRLPAEQRSDGIMPPSTPTLLHELSLEDTLSDVPLEQIVHLRAVSRECEFIAVDNGRLRAPTNIHDLRRLLRIYDDFALKNRPFICKSGNNDDVFDKQHQYALFLARMKIVNVLENCIDFTATPAPVDIYLENHYYVEAARISDVELALWLLEKNACHPHMLLVREGGIPGHRLQSCSLECYWQSLLSLMAAWPFLSMDEFAVRVFNEMRRRCAFFCSYREYASPEAKRKFDAGEKKVMGLNTSLFTLLNFSEPPPSNSDGDTVRGGGKHLDNNEDSFLLDNFDLATINAEGYVAINTNFIDEMETILHHMQLQLRQAVGFTRAPPAVDGCYCCRLMPLTQAHIDRLETIVTSEMTGTFRASITEAFRTTVVDEYVQPSEFAVFGELHEREVQTALNCVSRLRQADFRKMSTTMLIPMIDAVWKQLKGKQQEPAYAVMMSLAINFYMQQHMRGAQLKPFYVRTEKLRPFAHLDERYGQRRNSFGELHRPRQTTGTLRFRNKLLQEAGIHADPLESEYEHPLILRSMNSYDIHFAGHTHRCESFAHAFLHWLETFCEDRHIRGQLPVGGSLLFGLYRSLFPERSDHIRQLEVETHKKIKKYNPVTKLVGEAELDDEFEDEAAAASESDRKKRPKLEMYKNMSQF
jgi:hypothetical protein